MSTEGVPPKSEHTAVMAGNEMFVWGGNADNGFRYDPGTDTWTAMSTIGAPSSRRLNAAAWTGNEMIVWGGQGAGGEALNSGGRYDPMTDTWTAMSTVMFPDVKVSTEALEKKMKALTLAQFGNDLSIFFTNMEDF